MNIRRILVPTDLSAVSADALHYAAGLAMALGIRNLDVVHVFTPQAAPDMAMIPPVEDMIREREEALRSFLRQLASSADIELRPALYLGFAADEITRLSVDYDLIIMGTLGESDILDRVFGSISSAVAQRADCPVLLVPASTRFEGYENLLYASDDLSLSREIVLKLMEFNDLFKARIHFVHVNTGVREGLKGARERLFATLFAGPEPEFAFEITEVQAAEVEDGLHQYMESNPVDMVVMATRHRGFWERFFHTSQTRRMALHAERPLLVFHWTGKA